MKPHRTIMHLALSAAFMSCALADHAKVLALLEAKCSKCHSEGDEEPELNGGTNLEKLLKTEMDGKPVASGIIDRISRSDDAKGRMPKSKGKPGDPAYVPPLTAGEIGLIMRWAGGSPNAPAVDQPPPPGKPVPEPGRPTRSAISPREEIGIIAADIEKQPSSTRPFLRYLTLGNLANLRDEKGEPAESEEQLDIYRAALGKLLNSLSHEGRIHVPTPVDAGKTVYRFDLRNYGWTADQWERDVVGFYPYGLRGFDARHEEEIATETGSRSAWVRADWFVFAASQPPLYNRLLRLPDSDRELEANLGVAVADNLRNGKALRAGFRNSGVSQGNRMIERHELGRYPGAYWKSYDFSPLVHGVGHDLFRSPLGPPGAGLTPNKDREFTHDGGEIIWSLPNGLNGYYLSTSAGRKLDRAPSEIVQDKKRRDGAILNGISCISCHEAGMKVTLDQPLEKFIDEVAPVALKAGLDRTEQRNVEALYATPEKLRAVFTEDETRFKNALSQAIPDYRGGVEPVGRLYNRFKMEIRLGTLAAEFGEQDATFLRKLKDTRDPDLESIASQLESGLGFPRAGFIDQFRAICRALHYQHLDHQAMAYTEFASGIATAGGNQGQTPLDDGGRLSISTDKAAYAEGDLMTVKLKSTEGVFVRLFHLSADRKLTQIFPNAGQPDNFIKGGREVILPGPGDKFRFRMEAPFGTEIILAVASPVQFTDGEQFKFAGDEVFKSFSGHDLREVIRFGTKGLTVETQDATGKITGLRSAPVSTARAVFSVSAKH